MGDAGKDVVDLAWDYRLEMAGETVDLEPLGGDGYEFCLLPHRGSVIFRGEDETWEDTDEHQTVGHVLAYTLLGALAVEIGDTPIMLADTHSQELYEMAEALYESGGCHFREELGLESFGGSVLYISRLFLREEHRGKGLGHLLLDTLIQRYGEDRAVAMLDPAPLREVGMEKLEETAREEAVNILRRFYESLGFEGAGESRFLLLDLARPRPSVVEALDRWRKRLRVA